MDSDRELDVTLEGGLDAAFPSKCVEARPTKIGRFEVLERVGSGGTGDVYAAKDPALNRVVAIKLMRRSVSHDLRIRAAFESEARITSQLQHPGIVPIHECGFEPDGRPYIVMKLVRGRSLHGLLRDERSREHGPGELLTVLQRVAEAVAYAHQRGVVHGDLKPQNVLIGEFGEVLVTDWGFARLMAGTTVAASIRDEDVVNAGTPAYMAPEQIDPALGEVGPRADVFALGVLLFQMLTARTLGAAGDGLLDKDARLRGIEDAADHLRSAASPRELADFAARSLAINPMARPATAAELVRALTSWSAGLAERIRQRDAEAAEARVRLLAEKRQRRAIRLAAITSTLTIVVGVWSWASSEIQGAERMAEADGAATGALNRAELLADQAEHLESPSPDAWKLARAEAATAGDVAQQMDVTASVNERIARVTKRIDGGLKTAEHLLAVVADLDAHIEHVHDHGNRRARGQRYLEILRAAGIEVSGRDSSDIADAVRASPIRKRLVRLLDTWGAARDLWTSFGLPASPGAIAAMIDPDPGRRRIRQAMADADVAALVALAGTEGWDRQDVDSAIMLADALTQSERRALAATVLREAAQLFPGNYRVHHDLGVLLRGQIKDARGAVDAFRSALALRPASVHARQDLAHALLLAREYTASISESKLALRGDKNQSATWNYIAQAELGLGNADNALNASAEALRIEPSSMFSVATRLRVLMGLGRVADEIAWVEEAAQKYAADHVLLAQCALALWQAQRYGLALRAANTVMSRPPGIGEAAYVQGSMLMLADSHRAMGALALATELTPDLAEAWCNLGSMRREEGLLEAALLAMRRGHELGTRGGQWTYPSGRWIVEIERVIALRDRLKRGEKPALPVEADEAMMLMDAAVAAGETTLALSAFEQLRLAQMGGEEELTERLPAQRLRRAAEMAAAEVGVRASAADSWRQQQALRAATWFGDLLTWTERVAVHDDMFASFWAGEFLKLDVLAATTAARPVEWPSEAWERLVKVRSGFEVLAARR